MESLRSIKQPVAVATLTRLLAIGHLALLVVSWKLWTPQDVFPQVPLIRAACEWPAWIDWACFAVLMIASLALLIVPNHRRMAGSAMAVSLAGFFVLDQHRLQPWAWQFFLLAILLSLADDVTVRRGWMWLAISIYFWSAVSKLDYTFCHEQGPAILGGLKNTMGLKGIPNRWTRMLDIVGSFGIAVGELGVAVLLAWPGTRYFGVWIATIMHITLLTALGPLGLNHSAGVLLWNVFFIAQNWLLFRSPRIAGQSIDQTANSANDVSWLRRIWHQVDWPRTLRNRLALLLMIVAVIWPVLEPFGYCDHWLAWAVYSARPGKTEINSHPDFDVTSLPLPKESFAIEIADRGGIRQHPIQFCRLDVSQWSLQELGVPSYPQKRFQVAVVQYLVDRFKCRGVFVHYEPRNRWSGQPGATQITTIDSSSNGELETLTDSFFWNVESRRLNKE